MIKAGLMGPRDSFQVHAVIVGWGRGSEKSLCKITAAGGTYKDRRFSHSLWLKVNLDRTLANVSKKLPVRTHFPINVFVLVRITRLWTTRISFLSAVYSRDLEPKYREEWKMEQKKSSQCGPLIVTVVRPGSWQQDPMQAETSTSP